MIVDFDPKWLVSLMKQPLEDNGKFTFIGCKSDYIKVVEN